MTRTTVKTYNTERKLFYASALFLLVVFAAYIYFVSAAVAHVVVRKELTQEISEAQTRISELEAEYIASQQAVELATALSRGFAPNEEKVFVKKADMETTLSLNDSR